MNETEYLRKDVFEANREQDREQVANLAARFDDLKDSVSNQNSKQGTLIGTIALLFTAMQVGMAVVLWILSQPVK